MRGRRGVVRAGPNPDQTGEVRSSRARVRSAARELSAGLARAGSARDRVAAVGGVSRGRGGRGPRDRCAPRACSADAGGGRAEAGI